MRTKRLISIGYSISFSMALMAFASIGCSGGKGAVSGKVTLDGNPLPAGTIMFYPASGQGVSAEIIDGAYTATDVPKGDVKVVVQTDSIQATIEQMEGSAEGMRKSPNRLGTKLPEGMSAEAQAQFEQQQQAGGNQAAEIKRLRDSYRMIPEQYTDKNKTPLGFTVKSGNNTFDATLTK